MLNWALLWDRGRAYHLARPDSHCSTSHSLTNPLKWSNLRTLIANLVWSGPQLVGWHGLVLLGVGHFLKRPDHTDTPGFSVSGHQRYPMISATQPHIYKFQRPTLHIYTSAVNDPPTCQQAVTVYHINNHQSLNSSEQICNIFSMICVILLYITLNLMH